MGFEHLCPESHESVSKQLDVFTAWHVVFQETPNVALSGLQLALAANWHIADPEDFTNQGAFLLNCQDAALQARLFTLLETTFASCSRSTQHWALSPSLVAQLWTNIVNFFRLRAKLALPFVQPRANSLHAGDVSTIARSIVEQYSGVQPLQPPARTGLCPSVHHRVLRCPPVRPASGLAHGPGSPLLRGLPQQRHERPDVKHIHPRLDQLQAPPISRSRHQRRR